MFASCSQSVLTFQTLFVSPVASWEVDQVRDWLEKGTVRPDQDPEEEKELIEQETQTQRLIEVMVELELGDLNWGDIEPGFLQDSGWTAERAEHVANLVSRLNKRDVRVQRV